MSRIVVIEERCKGCQLCAVACPRKIIRLSGRMNRLGYRVAEQGENAEECAGCAGCAVMCPDVAIRVFRTKKTKREAHP